ncbi:Iron-sulfur cluster repair protein YtfE, partial [Frankliniella fusca]
MSGWPSGLRQQTKDQRFAGSNPAPDIFLLQHFHARPGGMLLRSLEFLTENPIPPSGGLYE